LGKGDSGGFPGSKSLSVSLYERERKQQNLFFINLEGLNIKQGVLEGRSPSYPLNAVGKRRGGHRW